MNTIIRRAAFTITELLVVISIIVLLMAIAVPAFSSLMSSQEKALAENQLKAALSAARDAAIQSETGDSAAVFFFTPGGRVTVVSCISMGRLPAPDIDQDPSSLPREVFVPVPSSEPMQMPKGWSVRGLAAVGTAYDPTGASGVTLRESWYCSYFNGNPDDAVEGDSGWVFPETAMFVPEDAGTPAPTNAASLGAPNARIPNVMGAARRTFVVRFKMGSGEVDLNNRDSVLVFDPYTSSSFRTAAPYSTFRADQLRIRTTPSPNAATYVRRLLADPELNDFANAARAAKSIGYARALLGVSSPDTILARPVSELALYQETHLASGIGATRLNAVTGTLWAGTGGQPHYAIDTSLLPSGVNDQKTLSLLIRNWIEGRDTGAAAGVPATREPYDARIFTLTRYLGQAEEVKP